MPTQTLLATAVMLIAMTFATETSATPVDIALGASTTGTSQGWGGGSYPADLVDGLTAYTDTWAHGVAFSGGNYPVYGPGGIQYAQINFSGMETFNEVVMWHHGDDHFPASSFVQFWDGASWEPLTISTRTIGSDSDYPTVGWGARSETLLFNTVSADSIRYGFDNSIGQNNINGTQITHGWLYEMQVFNTTTTAVPEPSLLYLLAVGIGMFVPRLTRGRHV